MNPLKAIIYNCSRATYLTDKRLEGKITFRESIALRIHLYGCAACRLYVKQSAKISEMIGDLLKSQQPQGVRLADDFKAGLQERIDHQINKN